MYANIYYWENPDLYGVSELSLDDSNLDRELTISSGFYFGVSTSDETRVTSSSYGFSWEGNGRYNLAGTVLESGSRTIFARNEAGQIIDMQVASGFPSAAGASISFVGDVQFLLYPTSYSVNDGSTITAGGYTYGLFPQRMQLLVNGEPVGDVYTSDGQGKFTFDYSHPLTSYVNQIGYRFYFDTAQQKSYSASDSTLSRHLLMGIFDNAVVSTVDAAPEYVPLFQEVINEVKQVPSTIYNFFFGDSGDEAASGFKSEVDSAVSSVDQVQQEIEEGLDKPEPDTIVPDLEEVVPQEDYTVYTDIFAPVMQSSLFTSMMLVVVSMAFVSYVLFGKKG